jgi:hypothetical protein
MKTKTSGTGHIPKRGKECRTIRKEKEVRDSVIDHHQAGPENQKVNNKT